jgi:CBS domain-containing protein
VDHSILVGLLAKSDLGPVAVAMSHAPETIPSDGDVAEAARVLADRGCDAVPVATEGIVLALVSR